MGTALFEDQEIMDSLLTDTVLCNPTIAVSDTLHVAASACTFVWRRRWSIQ